MKTKYSKIILESAVKSSISVQQVLKKLNLALAGGNHSYIKKLISYYEIDTSHFLGMGFLKGKTHSWSPRLPIDLMFIENSTTARKNIKHRIIKDSLLPYECSHCNNKGEHNNKPLVLELDHINGVYNDNRLENLRFLCPNCHSQTDTSSGKNKKK